MDVQQLDRLGRRLRNRVPLIGPWLRRRAAKRLAADRSPDAARWISQTLASHSDRAVCEICAAGLRLLRDPKAIDAASAVWEETRHDGLTALLRQGRWLASAPVELRVLTALKTGQRQTLLHSDPEVIGPLVRALDDADAEIAASAAAALGDLEAPAQVDAFCDFVARLDNLDLRRIALQKRYTPRDPGKRALFYFMSGQTERYETLDFDHQLLRANYEVADDELRQSIAARVRTSGRAELAMVIQGGREKRTLGNMTGREWEAVISVLWENRRLEDLWAVVFEAPPEWSAETLSYLKQAGFRPDDEAAAAFYDRLQKLRPTEGRQWRFYLPSPICRNILRGHEHGVRTLALARDGRTLASGSNDTTTVIWDLLSGRLRAKLTGQAGPVLALAFSCDGKSLVVGRGDHTARFWDLSSRKLKGTFAGHTDRVTAVGFSPDNQTVGTGSQDQTVRLWDAASKECRAVLQGHQRGVLALAFSPDGKALASGSHDETVILWYAHSGNRKAVLTGHTSSVLTLAYSPDGRMLASGSSDGTVRLWNMPSGELQRVLEGHKGTVMTVAISPDGKKVASGSLDKTVRVWDVHSGQTKITLQGHTDEVNALVFSPDGKILVTGSRDSTVRVWELAGVKSLAAMSRADLDQIQKWAEALNHPEEARGCHFIAALLRHRFRFDIELDEVAERVLGEFDIEIDDRVRRS